MAFYRFISALAAVFVLFMFFCPTTVSNKPFVLDLPAKIFCGDTSEKNIALTFDDGPYPAYTLKILEILEKYEIKATFFIVGKVVKENYELVKKIDEKGHEIGNHSYNDLRMTHLLTDDVIKQINKTKQEIKNATEKNTVLFRPPGGRYNGRIINITKNMGYTMVLWSINSNDYGSKDREKTVNNVVKKAHNGAIVLLHNGVQSTIEALPEIIEKLRKKGYNFVKVSHFLEKMSRKNEIAGVISTKEDKELD